MIQQLSSKTSLEEKVTKALDSIRPHLIIDGGDIELVRITDDMIVEVNLLGNCQNCDLSKMTMSAGVEGAVRSMIPDIKGFKVMNQDNG